MVRKAEWLNSPLALTQRCSNLLMKWGLPIILLHLVDYVVQSTPPSEWARDTVLLDGFSGQQALSQYYREQGLAADHFDLLDGPDGDILEPKGFCQIIKKVLKIAPCGLLFGGPPCGSWVYINRATSKRQARRIFGDCSRLYVRHANTITTRWIMLGLLAASRAVQWLTEQPRSSVMMLCPYVRYAALALRPLCWKVVSFPMGCYGHRSQKPSLCFGTSSWLESLSSKLTLKDKERIKKNKEDPKKAMVIRTISKRGSISVRQGGPGMKDSAAYPRKFAKKIHKEHTASMEEATSSGAFTSGPAVDNTQKPLKGPFRWRHARLAGLKEFLLERIADGSYRPILTHGLGEFD
ncbi:unnamed protein product [Cladocopium goreaui]|uniref:Uncharacterized protein n=1 Tax=Cladocopium goreaui TaxID=2562237 RepID=A0A9P1GBW6_9DINO|nr:unnamed protein product [Cladocopium goreaui]